VSLDIYHFANFDTWMMLRKKKEKKKEKGKRKDK